jgi:hypothetical protein
MSLAADEAAKSKPAEPDWSISLANIEGCSCPMFCQCYFTGQPALHVNPDEGASAKSQRYCRFNNAFKVEKGNWGDTKLDGIKVWMAGDLGSDFSKGQMDWGVIHFEPAATPEQRDAVQKIISHIFPVKWNSFTVGKDYAIDWKVTDDGAQANLDDGKAAQIKLKANKGMDDKTITLEHMKFWAAPRTSGFKLMANEIEAYKLTDKAFEFHGTNGFVVTVDMNSKDVAAAEAKEKADAHKPADATAALRSCCAGGKS